MGGGVTLEGDPYIENMASPHPESAFTKLNPGLRLGFLAAMLLVAALSCRSERVLGKATETELGLGQDPSIDDPFTLSGFLMGPGGWPASGRHFYAVTQKPQEMFVHSSEVHRGSFDCDELGAFQFSIPDLRIDSHLPLQVRLGASSEVVRGRAYMDVLEDPAGMDLYSELVLFRDQVVEGRQVQGLDLSQVQLEELPCVAELWLESDEVRELECGIAAMPKGPVVGSIDVSETGFTLRADQVLRLYSEIESQDLHLHANWRSGWALAKGVIPMGSSVGLEVYPSSVTTLIARQEDHPDGFRWQWIRADRMPPSPIVPTEDWSWKTLVRSRTGPYGQFNGKSRTIINLYPGEYKALIWSEEPTADGMPLRVIDLGVLGGEDRRVRVR